MITRRKLLIAVSACALTAPFGSIAQQTGKVWRVGYLSQRTRPDSFDSHQFGAFMRGMRELGYVEGKNLVIEWRFAENKVERLPDLAAELVRSKVDVIVTQALSATTAAQKATPTIPIVMASGGDPVPFGLAKSLARPGGNVTGFSNIISDLSPKLLELLRGMVPKLSRVAVMVNPDNPGNFRNLESVQAAAQRSGLQIIAAQARTQQEIENAFSMMARENAGALIVGANPFFNQQIHQIVELGTSHRLPFIASSREYTEAGGLMSYGPDPAENHRLAATYVDKIFKGANPGELPIQQPTKFELFFNRKTAKALGLTIPQSLLISADKVIE